MTRQLSSLCLAAWLLAWLPASGARAEEMPNRRAGLWEMKVIRSGTPIPDMTMQHCTDEATDKEMNASFAPTMKDACSRRDIRKTATGYVSDSVCTVGVTATTSHADITGDFNSAFTVKSTSHSVGGPSGQGRDSTTTMEAKWLGACKPDQKPGDIVMPGGYKMNVSDAAKLRTPAPK